MHKSLILVLSSILLLSSCSIDWNDAKTQKISELEKQVTELKSNSGSTFEKWVRCGQLTSDIQKRLDSIQKEYTSLGKFSVGGIFYSPVRDACLWIRIATTTSPDGYPMERRSLYQFGQDFGASEPIVGCDKILQDTNGVNTCDTFETEIKRLKGENVNILVP